jgi:hypothetical protein
MTRICWKLFFLCIFAAVAVRPAAAQTSLEPVITTLQAGDVLQGISTINVSNNLSGFTSSEVAFAYTGDPTGTWFLIAQNNQPIDDGTLATWDTTTISDGNYILRLRVFLSDGSFHDATVPNLRVRNYTPIETPTPAPTPLQATVIPTDTPTITPYPTPTTLPKNPAILTPTDVSISIGYGGVAAVIILVLVGFYLWLRRK